MSAKAESNTSLGVWEVRVSAAVAGDGESPTVGGWVLGVWCACRKDWRNEGLARGRDVVRAALVEVGDELRWWQCKRQCNATCSTVRVLRSVPARKYNGRRGNSDAGEDNQSSFAAVARLTAGSLPSCRECALLNVIDLNWLFGNIFYSVQINAI